MPFWSPSGQEHMSGKFIYRVEVGYEGEKLGVLREGRRGVGRRRAPAGAEESARRWVRHGEERLQGFQPQRAQTLQGRSRIKVPKLS